MIAIIPARYGSSRLEGKLLLPLAGRPLILHTVEQASHTETVSRVIVATDDMRIFNTVSNAGFEAVMTSEHHRSGSDRIAEVATGLPSGTIIVNVQGDEPLIAPETINAAVNRYFKTPDVDIATTMEKITELADVLSPDCVKVVVDRAGYALYFSRSPIPFPRESASRHGGLDNALTAEPELISSFNKHTGLYVYSREFLLEYTMMERTELEETELLEQLRALENGARIAVVEAPASSIGVDTAEDLERVNAILAKSTFGKIEVV